MGVFMSVWLQLETLLREQKQFRGNNSVTLADLQDMLDDIMDKGEILDGDLEIDPEGGFIVCKYQFDPKIWGNWMTNPNAALIMATSDKDVVNQYAGRPQGGTVTKKNWGGRIKMDPGKARTDFERLPSAMDRYDVIMIGEITDHTGAKGNVHKKGILQRVAYSPSIGSSDERLTRLKALANGQQPPPLSRRPQPVRPEPTPDELKHRDKQYPDGSQIRNPPPVPRQGQNLKIKKPDDY